MDVFCLLGSRTFGRFSAAAEELKSLIENFTSGRERAPYELHCRMHPVLDSPSSPDPLQIPHSAKSH